MKAQLAFDLLTYWHAGTGRGKAAGADAIVQRSPEGLPYLPGRTVKGLLRQAVAMGTWFEAPTYGIEDVEAWFGTSLPPSTTSDDRVDVLEAARFRTRPGTLRFSSATLGEAWANWARTVTSMAKAQARPPTADAPAAPSSEDIEVLELAPLFTTLASTRIDERGVAYDRTLRTREVAVPMVLMASVDGPDDRRWIHALQHTASFVRGLGSGRNRGLGRVALTVQEVP